MSGIQVALLSVWGLVSFALIVHLWWRPEGGWPKRLFWTLVVCVPIMGWIFYGGLYRVPEKNQIKAQGGASGWGTGAGG